MPERTSVLAYSLLNLAITSKAIPYQHLLPKKRLTEFIGSTWRKPESRRDLIDLSLCELFRQIFVDKLEGFADST